MAASSLAPDEFVYRALLRKQWIDPDNGQVKPEAFLLRPCKDHDGLSVFRARYCQPEECAGRFRACFGVGELRVGSVRSLDGLDVIQRDKDPCEQPLIVGLPTTQEDRARAERLAGLLARQARLVRLHSMPS